MTHGRSTAVSPRPGMSLSVWRRWLVLGGLLLGLGMAYGLLSGVRTAVRPVMSAMTHGDVGALKAFILSFGPWAPAMSFLLMILQTLIAPLPAFALAIANAMAFGLVYGCALSCASALVVAFIAFYLSRWFGRSFLERWLSVRPLSTFDAMIEKYGVLGVLIARLFPVISFDLVSFAAGLTAMRVGPFGLATFVGMLPAAIAFSLLGDSLASANRWSLIGGAVLLGLLLTVAACMRKRTVWRPACGSVRCGGVSAPRARLQDVVR